MNNYTAVGRIAHDLELIKRGDSVVCNFNLAVDRKGTKEKTTDFIPCELWGGKAESLVKNSGKGLLLCIRGEIHVTTFEDKDNKKTRKNVTVYVNETDILEWKKSKDVVTKMDYAETPFPGEE